MGCNPVFKLKIGDSKKSLHITQETQRNEITFAYRVTRKVLGLSELLGCKISLRQLEKRTIAADFHGFILCCFIIALLFEPTITSLTLMLVTLIS